MSSETESPDTPSDFIRDIVAQHVAEKRYAKIVTRFPPEPNGFLHLGHARAILLNFGIARENGGQCNLRFDDTNPAKEDASYVDAITHDIKWLIEGWADEQLASKPQGAVPVAQQINDRTDYQVSTASSSDADTEAFTASDYFDQLYNYALDLIKKGHAFVCDLSATEIEEYRGSLKEPGRDSPFRDRSVEENLDLFERMRAGEFPDGAKSLRAKIDMTSPNLWLRDPLLYRIRHIAHHHTGDKWCLYPLYDYAHCLSDYLEGVTHSFCSLEFVVHRPLYDWVLASLDLPRELPHQYEFAKLIPSYTLMSKRNLLRLVEENHVAGWDDPRMPTIAGLRRLGISAAIIRRFVIGTGITTNDDSITDIAAMEHIVRDELNQSSERRLGVLKPIKIVLTNLAPDEVIECEATNDPQAETPTKRKISLTREVFIESDDFAEIPPPKFRRLKPGGEVRLKYACIIGLDEIIKDADGNVTELHCTAQLDTRSSEPSSSKKVKGTIHWVSATLCHDLPTRLYDRLFTVEEPGAEEDFVTALNPNSLEVVAAKVEPSLADAVPGVVYQFERLGYFTADSTESTPGNPVFNRTITLRDTWGK